MNGLYLYLKERLSNIKIENGMIYIENIDFNIRIKEINLHKESFDSFYIIIEDEIEYKEIENIWIEEFRINSILYEDREKRLYRIIENMINELINY